MKNSYGPTITTAIVPHTTVTSIIFEQLPWGSSALNRIILVTIPSGRYSLFGYGAYFENANFFQCDPCVRKLFEHHVIFAFAYV